MNENAMKTKWNEINRHEMNENETKTTWTELKTKRNKNEMKRAYNEITTNLKRDETKRNACTRALTGYDAPALSVPVQRPGLTRLLGRRIFVQSPLCLFFPALSGGWGAARLGGITATTGKEISQTLFWLIFFQAPVCLSFSSTIEAPPVSGAPTPQLCSFRSCARGYVI